MSRVPEAERALNATTVRGLTTCTLPATPYRRIITNIKVMNPVEGEVFVYVGSLDNLPIAKHFVGSNNTLKGELELGGGQNLFVVWTNGPANTSLATAEVSADRTEGGERAASTSLTWDAVQAQRSLLAPDLVAVVTNPTVAANTQTFSALLDMRAYQSAEVVVDSVFTTNAVNYRGETKVGVVWRDEPPLGGSQRVIYADTYSIWTRDPNVTPLMKEGRFHYQDAVHGPFLAVSAFNLNTSALNASITIAVYGNSRAIPGRFIRNYDGSVGQNNGSGQDYTTLFRGTVAVTSAVDFPLPLRLAPGKVRYYVSCVGPYSFYFRDIFGNQNIWREVGVANDIKGEFVAPGTAMNMIVNSTATENVEVSVTADRPGN